ncbi:TPA: hypothetical protein ACGT9I_004031 [Salmonella enterica]|jgi:hypothetical protein|nr:hypothetical protein [Salmonella enterica subsp. enterica]EDT1338814.1 hypothetical protein [Salmonella enterica subsp. enterica serovar Enteritidis]EHJ3658461.1 hypothetical protein [Salmonella enterica]HDO5799804.1 hypothetical protein [Salmonella enterica subsp. enterica serovar Typhimurium]HED0201613.1 hypothetical protein [Salmonella enterica subsp. enterica serovar Orientalis]
MTGKWEIDKDMKPCKLSGDVADAFTDATKYFVGAKYIPILYVGKQIVSGCNYMFVCKQILSTEHTDMHVVKMVIYKPVEGKAEILSVEQLLF